MTVDIQDPAVAAALEHATGHIGPYPDDELAKVRELRVVGAGSLDDVASCSGLEQLTVIGADVTDLGALSSLKELRRLSVLACPVTSADGLVGLDQLEELRLDFGFVEDASPVFALPSLRRARLVGQPWSEASWQRFQHHALPPAHRHAARRPIFELGAESETVLDATRRLRSFGIDLCFGALDALRMVLVRPGRARVPGLECDWTVATTGLAWREAKGPWTTDTMFDKIRDRLAARGENVGFDFESHREFGDRGDALGWIAAETDPTRRSSLERFIERFPGAVFFREDDVFQAMVERHGGVGLPASYRNARKILAGAFPERKPQYRVDRFEGSSTVASKLSEVWYRSQFEDYASDEGPTMRDTVRLYPFAFWPPENRSTLAVALDGDQPEIYEYRETDVFFELQRGNPPEDVIFRVYSSHAELLGHVVAFKLGDDTVIEAHASAPDR